MRKETWQVLCIGIGIGGLIFLAGYYGVPQYVPKFSKSSPLVTGIEMAAPPPIPATTP